VVKRIVAGILWFYTVASVWNGIALLTGAPGGAGVLFGALVAIVVWSNAWRVLGPTRRESQSADRPATATAFDPTA
jgi:hypothetical protein